MAVKKQFGRLVFVLSLGLLMFSGYMLLRNNKLQQEVNRYKELEGKQLEYVVKKEEVKTADSLLIRGQYQQAINQYEQYKNDPDLPTEFRIVAATRLRDMQREISHMQIKQVDGDSLRKPSISPKLEAQRVIDSLSFALEKSHMQLQNIKNQVQSRVYGEYITFKSRKGNRLHYVGEVKYKKANGYGIAILDSGSRYEGQWLNNQRHGEGVFYWIDGEHYEGSYKDDQRSGTGTYYWTTGEKFTGNWENDMRNGYGTFYGKDGKKVTSGYWEDDQLIKKGEK